MQHQNNINMAQYGHLTRALANKSGCNSPEDNYSDCYYWSLLIAPNKLKRLNNDIPKYKYSGLWLQIIKIYFIHIIIDSK